MQLSILDQAPISDGKNAQEALYNSIELAKLGDRLGFTRYWMAEHHDLSGLACPSPEVMLGIIGSATSCIRIGSGAVLLPHYKAFKVAETYNLLATLYPGRVDLGLGRAPGGSAEATMALSDNFLENVRRTPDSLDDLLHFLHNDFAKDHMFAKVQPSPVPQTEPRPWLLGTSEKSAILAAEKGLPYTFGHFMSDRDGPAIVKKYYDRFSSGGHISRAEAIVTVSVICAETTEKAEELAMSSKLWGVKRSKGEDIGVPSVEEAKNYPYTADDLALIKKSSDKMIVGNPQEVKQRLDDLCKLYQVNELMIVTITSNIEDKFKSYDLIAKEVL
ncbi:LLM class flavin-dependent oxidoreductase [Virgibacillus phasianinus]|uniref:LLM class flavin-dependent oxidoreductase n=1 Tax=Virgibacillus phasianinus TaxID=2017483 RepID=A0A220U3B1_9BACI|nr:LLM class flavin-dependent oxidoreductase [Virgibacillus phasianinus]ASK62774.1 LLM class flavin-dependent oxidoreductase [Virgibacillus phasianinus]